MPLFRRSTTTTTVFGAVLAQVERDAPAAPRPERLHAASNWSFVETTVVGAIAASCVAFCAYAVVTTINDPNYFSERLISSLQRADLDPIQTGTIAAAPAATDALPVPIVARANDLKPEDYQIVMVFDHEAILATTTELFRVKVGSTLPGLGVVKEIVPNGDGGTIAAEKATLKTAPGP